MKKYVLDYAAMGRRMQEMRQGKNLTQQELAKAARVSVSYIGHIERGTKRASLDVAAQISVALGVSVDYFIFGGVRRDDKNEIIREYLRQQLAACAGSNGSCS